MGTFIPMPDVSVGMHDQDPTGEFFGIPYNFEPPKLSRLLKSYWQPGEGLLVPKPFGIGYTLNLANWKSWVVIAVAAAMVVLERRQTATREAAGEEQEPVEVIVDE